MKYSGLTLGEIEAIVNMLGGVEGVKKFLRGELVVSEAQAEGLLRHITTTSVSGANRFVADKESLKAANIGWTSGHFERLFLPKVEMAAFDTLAVSELTEASTDALILEELGDRAEISLTHFFRLLERQANGEGGLLLINGDVNIAYIRGVDGNLWAVNANWDDKHRYWFVFAGSVERSGKWLEGCRVLSRDRDF